VDGNDTPKLDEIVRRCGPFGVCGFVWRDSGVRSTGKEHLTGQLGDGAEPMVFGP